MTKWLADSLADSMIGCGALPREKRAILAYGMEALISTVIGVLLIAAVSAVSGEYLAWMFFLLGFAPLRRTAGGFHANTHAGCYFVFTAVFTLCVVVEISDVVPEIAYVIADAVSVLTVLLLAPCVPPNKPLKGEQEHKNRAFSIVLVVFGLMLGLILFLLGVKHSYIHFWHFGILSAAVSLVAAKIKNKYKGENRNEKET